MNTYVNKKTAITVQLNSDNCFLSFLELLVMRFLDISVSLICFRPEAQITLDIIPVERFFPVTLPSILLE